jgi:hypothetical protein
VYPTRTRALLHPARPVRSARHIPVDRTISFLPERDDLVHALPRFGNRPPDRKHLGTYSVRFEGIDALETHFQNHHQNSGSPTPPAT